IETDPRTGAPGTEGGNPMNLCVSAAVVAFAVVTTAPPEPEGPRTVSFRRDVIPILARKCLGCHNERKSSGGLSMRTFATLRNGGRGAGDAVLEPGDPDASYLIESVRPGALQRMPYKLPALSPGEVHTLEEWVRQGARFDGESPTETPLA